MVNIASSGRTAPSPPPDPPPLTQWPRSGVFAPGRVVRTVTPQQPNVQVVRLATDETFTPGRLASSITFWRNASVCYRRPHAAVLSRGPAKTSSPAPGINPISLIATCPPHHGSGTASSIAVSRSRWVTLVDKTAYGPLLQVWQLKDEFRKADSGFLYHLGFIIGFCWLSIFR